MPHKENPKVFKADKIRTHEICGLEQLRSPVISGDLIYGKTGHYEELYVAGVKHIPKINFVYAFRFGGPCTKSDYYNASANDGHIYVSNPYLFASGDHMIVDCGGSGEETRLVSGVLGDYPPAGVTPRNFVKLYDNLFFNHNIGEQVCNKFGTLREHTHTGVSGVTGCTETCYDAAHLYVERGTGLQLYGGDMTWYVTGYRDYFIGYSGIETHISGLDIHGLLTFIYPDE